MIKYLILCSVYLCGCDFHVPNPSYLKKDLFSFDTQVITEKLKNYQDGNFTLVNNAPIKSKAIPNAWINIWISEEGVDQYSSIDFDGIGSHTKLPMGAMIVREVIDKHSSVSKLTVIAQAPDGSYPEGGDLWFATASPNGVIEDESKSGFLSSYNGCHATRSNDVFLFGTYQGGGKTLLRDQRVDYKIKIQKLMNDLMRTT